MAPTPIFAQIVHAGTEVAQTSDELDEVEGLIGSNLLSGPLWPCYAGLEERRRTFFSRDSKWPPGPELIPLAERLASSGFFGLRQFGLDTKREDYAVCFYCGRGHVGWEKDDLPMLWHETSFGDSCTRLRLIKRRRTTVPSYAGELLRQAGGEALVNLAAAPVCKICLTYKVDTLLLPCSHAVSCSLCASRLGRCPLCRRVPICVVPTYD